MTATDTAFSGISDTNSRRYASLKRALTLGLRQKIWIAVCDDSDLRRAIADGLFPGGDLPPAELRVPPNWVTLDLDPSHPDPNAQIRRWKTGCGAGRETPPVGFQIVGVERLTRQPPAIQRSFLDRLGTVPSQLVEFDCSLLLWLPSPWLGCIRQSAPEFWRWRAGLFEFVGDPTPPRNALPKPDKDPPHGLPQPPSPPPETDLKQCIERGRRYRDRICAGTASAADLEGGIRAYERVLAALETGASADVDDPDAGGCDRVALWNDVGTFHRMRFQQLFKSRNAAPDAISHLQQSIICYQKALAKIEPETSPAIYVKLQSNLGAAHTDLATIREPVENLQQSVIAYEEAIRVLRSSPEGGAADRLNEMDSIAIQNNLGTAHWNLAQYVRPVTHLKAAIAAYTEALLGESPDREPVRHAMIHANLGTAYWNLAQHRPSKPLLRRAIRSYRRALTYRTPATAPLACAATQNNLGTACWHLALSLDRPEDRMKFLQEAIAAYETALTLARQLSPAELTFDALATHNNLGLAHYRLATDRANPLTQADRVSHLDRALHHHAIAGWLEPSPPGSGNPEPPEITHRPDSERHRVAFDHLIRTLRAFYEASGWQGQNRALSRIPGYLLPEIWRAL
ncbi:tetratricopeptide repeat protein [Lyngbya sp. CCY1209]|uniref:tetratricopeptide repeat protein n=1 Tax=Lyngbya sp. CCY1209 TaxID=2886103 RepID=UPI002D207CDB|nr:tetratricopeptide repeat protein [Lyngbya sp. CCY1209]MEB3887481.1 tetratricopeptide repeat protein [Lyngbya sp. CCY1209]